MAHIVGIQTSMLQLLGSQAWCQRGRAFIPALSTQNRPRVSRISPFTSRPSFATDRRLQDQDESQSYEARLPKPLTYPPRAQQQQTSSQVLETPPSIATGDVTGNEEPTSASLQERNTENDTEDEIEDEDEGVRMPRSVQAIYLKPLRRRAKYNLPVCDLQIRSYSILNVEFMADFALRAAYYLHLPARGPVPLPRITERWTVPRSHFVHKKSQENFERRTMRRLIQIHDGHPETVQLWLAFIRKHSYYGVGMKANVWEYEKLGVGKTMDVSLENLKKTLEPKWAHFGRRKNLDTSEKVYQMMTSDTFRQTSDAPLRYDGITPQT